MSDNKLTSLAEVAGLYPNLKVLKFSNNQVKAIEDFSVIASWNSLENLDVSNNPAFEKLDDNAYMEAQVKLRGLQPTLRILNGFDDKGEEFESEDEDDEEEDGEDEDFEDDGEEAGEDDEEEGEEEQEDGESSETPGKALAEEPISHKRQKVSSEA